MKKWCIAGVVILLAALLVSTVAVAGVRSRRVYFSRGSKDVIVYELIQLRTGRNLHWSYADSPSRGGYGGPNFGADCAHDAACMYDASEAIEEFRKDDHSY